MSYGQFDANLKIHQLADFLKSKNLSISEYQSEFFEVTENLKSSENEFCSIYVHIPYCESKCTYCPYTAWVSNNDKDLDHYCELLIKEISLFKNKFLNKKVQSIYIGGGTPSLLSEEQIVKILESLKSTDFKFNKNIEFNFEFLPEHIVNTNKLKILISAVKSQFPDSRIRASLGIQSFDSEVCKTVNRPDQSQIKKEVIETLKDAERMNDFFSFNIDLMFGLPSQTIDIFNSDLEYLIQNEVPSISIEYTQILPGTALHRLQSKINHEARDSFHEIRMKYIEKLHKESYSENLLGSYTTWTKKDKDKRIYKSNEAGIIGFGVSSVSDYETLRTRNFEKLSHYKSFVEHNCLPHHSIRELSESDITFLKIRREFLKNRFIDIDTISRVSSQDYKNFLHLKISDLIQKGVLSNCDDKLSINKKYDTFDFLYSLKPSN